MPGRYSGLFRRHQRLLSGHRGFDPGALELARRLARMLHCTLIAATTTRLLVDLNRSPTNRNVFSVISRELSRTEREHLLATCHRPHRDRVAERVDTMIATAGRVLHIAVHTFTPSLGGSPRRADVGLLYDPARSAERRLCGLWQHALANQGPRLVVRRNYPYRGNSDGLPTWLRRKRPDGAYLGIELEVSQRRCSNIATAQNIARQLANSLQCALSRFGQERAHAGARLPPA